MVPSDVVAGDHDRVAGAPLVRAVGEPAEPDLRALQVGEDRHRPPGRARPPRGPGGRPRSWSAWLPWLKLSRATFMPASTRPRMRSGRRGGGAESADDLRAACHAHQASLSFGSAWRPTPCGLRNIGPTTRGAARGGRTRPHRGTSMSAGIGDRAAEIVPPTRSAPAGVLLECPRGGCAAATRRVAAGRGRHRRQPVPRGRRQRWLSGSSSASWPAGTPATRPGRGRSARPPGRARPARPGRPP